MKQFLILTIFIFSSLALFAQPKEVQIELNQTFAFYQNAYNNSSQAYKMLTKGYRRSSNLSDAHYYLGSARKYALKASEYCEKAIRGGENTLKLTSVKNCNSSKDKYSEMQENFATAYEKFIAAKVELDKALEAEGYDVIGEHMSTAVTYLQAGTQSLNLSVENMNTGSANMKGCK